jgi:hypothetical protein
VVVRYCMFGVMILALTLGLAVPARALEEDVTPPSLLPSVTGGMLRNIAPLKLDINEDHLKSSSIRIYDDEDTIVKKDDVAIGATDETGVVNPLEFAWDTRQLADGHYSIHYAATDTSDHTTTQAYDVEIANNKPVVTIADTQTGRELHGTVTRSDVVFKIVIDGNELAVQPTVQLVATSDGTYEWTLAVPEEVTDGAHAVSVWVTPSIEGGVESDKAERSVILQTVIPEDPEPETPVGPIFPGLDPVEPIGQFIAPLIEAIQTVQTKLFGVSVDDLTTSTPDQAGLVSTPSTKQQVLGAEDTKKPVTSGSPAVVEATGKGWHLLGIAWYWWMISLMAILGAGILVPRLAKPKVLVPVEE